MEAIHTRSKVPQKAILVGITCPDSYQSYSQPLEELANLATTAGIEVLYRITQARAIAHPRTYTGSGKVIEIKTMLMNLQADGVIYDDDLTPMQGKELESSLGVPVMDRTELILHIFNHRAQSREAKLQVELAELEYMLPRLKRLWRHLDRYEGGIGMKGPGEKQLELDKRLLKKRIQELSVLLQTIQERKAREVQKRSSNFITVGIVGYTNAGKSTLMNALTHADVLVEHHLFSTLETRTRLWDLCQGRKVMLSDTVGFIDKLPHHLVASFRATLEEAAQADLLLHVVDAAHPDVFHLIEVVENVLEELGLGEKSPLLVFNKSDAITDPALLANLQQKYPQNVAIAAKYGQNLDQLAKRVLEMIEADMVDLVVNIPVTQGKLLAWIEEYGRILSKELQAEQVVFHVRLTQSNANWLMYQLTGESHNSKKDWLA